MKKFVPILVIFLASSLIFLYFKGDYDSAIKLFKPLANQGNVEAQNWLESCLSLKEAYDTDENRLKNLMDWWKDKAIDSTKLEQILVQHKQYIFNEVYPSGTANSLKFIGNKGDVIEVSINWTDWVTQGNSIIGIDYSSGEPRYYEISVVKESNKEYLIVLGRAGNSKHRLVKKH